MKKLALLVLSIAFVVPPQVASSEYINRAEVLVIASISLRQITAALNGNPVKPPAFALDL
jgi:hypothetical protein